MRRARRRRPELAAAASAASRSSGEVTTARSVTSFALDVPGVSHKAWCKVWSDSTGSLWSAAASHWIGTCRCASPRALCQGGLVRLPVRREDAHYSLMPRFTALP